MNRRAIGGTVLGVLMAAGLGGVWQLQKKIDAERHAMYVEREDLMMQSGRLVKHLSLEYAPLMGAVYWTRAVQYYGNKHRLHDRNLELLWPLLDITTTLDSNLIVAYRFGATFLSEEPPRGAGQPDEAVKLLERGIRANPDYWRLYQDLGNVYYFDKKDYPKASQAFLEGSKNPDAKIWMKVMAAKIAAEGESLETSYFLWKEIYDTTKDVQVKKNAEEHLRSLKVDLDLRELGRLAGEYAKQNGRRATKMSELIQAGLLRGLPEDPGGFPYVLGKDGKAELNAKSPLREEKMIGKK
jgi:tetratricopeptide (TPR) repeat protein